MKPSSRLERIPPYLFAELERKIAAKREQGVDVISLGIGDPDTPTPEPVVEALAAGARDPGTHQYPSNRGRPEFREAVAAFYERRFGVTLDPATEIVPAIGAKECIFNLNLAFLDPNSFEEHDQSFCSTDPLKFVDSQPYPDRIKRYERESGLPETLVLSRRLLVERYW